MSSRNLVSTAIEKAEDAYGLHGPRAAFMASLQEAFATMLGKFDDALFELAQAAKGELERGVYFDAIRELRLGREAIDARFGDRLLSCWHALERGEGPVERQLGGNDLDEAVALTAAVRRAEMQCADALRAMRGSLALAVGVPDGDEVLGPRQVFAAFETAFRDTLTEPDVRRVLLMFFERHVGAAVPGIYRDLAAALEQPLGRAGHSVPADVSEMPPLDALIADSAQRGDLDLSALIQQALAGGGDGRPGSEATKLLATLQQHDKPGSRSRSASIDLARFATRPTHGAPDDPSQQVVLDMVALLFDGVFNDSAVPVSARLNIARLQIPFLRLALRDRAVLARRSHLGRRFFDQLIAVTRGWQEPPSAQQRQVLEALVDSVGEACMDDHRAFAAAAETGLMDLRTLALPAADPAAAGQAHRRTLGARAEKELAERRRQVGRIPDPVDTFLSTHWVQYLVDCLDSHGAEASPWRQALATLDALLWSLSPKEGAAQQRLAELRPRMTRRLRQGMDQIGVSMFEQEAFLETLETILDRAQAGQPVWDWDQESAIDELLGVNETLDLAPDAVSVVELGKPATPVRLVVPRPPRESAAALVEAIEVEAQFYDEEAVSIEELASALSSEDIAPLELPSGDLPAEAAEALALPEVDDPEIEAAEMEAPQTEADETGLDAGDVAADEDESPVEAVVGDADAPGDAAPTADPSAKRGSDKAPAAAEPELAVNSLEALIRRRGLSAVTHVEEVEVTDRGGRG